MDSFEFNKIAGAVLGTGVAIMALGIIAEIIYHPENPEQPGYVIAVAETGDGEGAGPAAPVVAPIAARLQTADVAAGEASSRKCQACHTFDKGGATKVGPNLWDTVDASVIHEADFNYSEAMREAGAAGMTWTYENLDGFLANPKGFMPGTAMTFIGLRNPEERANVIAYLRTLSDNPVPLPEPPPPPAETAEAPGDAAAPAGDAAPAGAAPAAAPETSPAGEAPANGDGAATPSEPAEQPAHQ